MKKILVTGGAGFIGSHTVKSLIDKGEKVVVIDDFNDYYSPSLKEKRINVFLKKYQFPIYREDIRNFDKLDKIFKKEKFTHIVHLAARAGVRPSIQKPLLYEEVNIKGTLNLLELSKNYNIKNFVFASSSSVYGGNTKIPFSEKDEVNNPISPYGATKKSCELLAKTYNNLYKIHCACLRYFTVYGSWGRPDMAFFLFTEAIMKGKEILVFNKGKMLRDFTYIDDIVAGTISSLEKQYNFEIFNLGNNHPTSLEYLIKLLETELGKKAKKKYLPLQSGDMVSTYANINKAKKMLGFKPKISIEEGVKRFVKWYKADLDLLD